MSHTLDERTSWYFGVLQSFLKFQADFLLGFQHLNQDLIETSHANECPNILSFSYTLQLLTDKVFQSGRISCPHNRLKDTLVSIEVS